MSLTLHWAAKEWRAQRGFLCGYLTLMIATVVSVLTIAHWRNQVLITEPQRIVAVASILCTVLAGGLFAAAHAVRGEVAGRDDQFWRRLPGALRPAFAGKVLFQAALLPSLLAVGVLAGEGYLWAMGLPLVRLSDVVANMESARFASLAFLVQWLCAVVPWVFAVAFWMRAARFAIGAAIVLLFGIALSVTGILSTSPGLEKSLVVPPLPPCVAALGLVVAWISCVFGRRGGGHLRSAKLGALATIVGLAPPAAWLGSWVHAYWRPDVRQLHGLDVRGANLRYAVVRGNTHANWPEVTARVDLQTGDAVRMFGPREEVTGWWSRCFDSWSMARAGICVAAPERDFTRFTVHDLATLESHRLAAEGDQLAPLPPSLRARLAAARRNGSPLRQPGNLPAWIEGSELCLANADGTVAYEPFPGIDCFWKPSGHGIYRNVRDPQHRHYDLTLRRAVALPVEPDAPGPGHFAVAGLWLVQPPTESQENWRCFDPVAATVRPVAQLPAGSESLGLLDDATALFKIARKGGHDAIGVYCPATDEFAELPLPNHAFLTAKVLSVTGGHDPSPYGERDPRNRRILYVHRGGRPGNLIVTIDPTTRACEVLLATDLLTQVLTFSPAGDPVCCEDYNRLVRYDRSGARTVIYPAAAR
jgi:hypothetical protein